MPNAYDYKKEFKDLYLPKNKPMLIEVPQMQFVAVEGKGNPNDESGEYPKAVQILYNIQFTIKMSKMGSNKLKGYFDYVVPPLEGFWWLEDHEKFTYKNKSKFCWISMIRLPEFVTKDILKWACKEVSNKKGINTEKVYLLKLKEGLCVQCIHTGPYDNEPKTLALMDRFMEENNLCKNLSETRHHHEIYLSDPRKTDPAKLRTVLRIPVKKK